MHQFTFFKKPTFILMVIVLLMAFTITSASAALVPIQEQQYSFKVDHDGPVLAFFTGQTAAYGSILTANIGGVDRAASIFNHGANIGDMFNFGPALAGDIIVFSLNVINTGNIFSSNMSLNADGLNHYKAIPLTTDTPFYTGVGSWFGVEDIYGGGDLDYNDTTFFMTNVLVSAVPEPAMAVMLLFGLIGVSIYNGKRKQGDAGSASSGIPGFGITS